MATMPTPNAQYINLADCIAELAAEVAVRRPTLAGRLAKAAALTDTGAARAVFPQGQPGCYYVHSACQDGTLYLVNLVGNTCTCKWAQHGDGSPCCHQLAARLLQAGSNLRAARQRAADYHTPLMAQYPAILAGLVA